MVPGLRRGREPGGRLGVISRRRARDRSIAARGITAALLLGLGALASATTGGALAQDARAVRDVLQERVGDLDLLRVPERDIDLPQPRLPDGSVDPRYAITEAKTRLGKLLFFDPMRSVDIRPEFGGVEGTAGTASCGSCHMGEAATKAGTVSAIGVGGEGRHVSDQDMTRRITRRMRDDVVDTVPTALEVFDDLGELVASGRYDAVDVPPRCAPSTIGYAYNARLLWSGDAGEPSEAGYPAQEDVVRIASRAHRMAPDHADHLAANAVYRELFARAFPEEAAVAETTGNVRDLVHSDTEFRAIASFLRTVISRDTPWDRFLAGDDEALSDAELRGAFIFAAEVADGGANCISCHSGPALQLPLGEEDDPLGAVDGSATERRFWNLATGDHPVFDLAREATGDPALRDEGRAAVTGRDEDAFAFKTPTLRQIRDAGPYFHGGTAATLREAVEYFVAGVPADPFAAAAGNLPAAFVDPRGDGSPGLGLAEEDIDALVAFLERGLYDPGLASVVPGSPTPCFELTAEELEWPEDLEALGAVDGWLPSGLPNGFGDELSRSQLVFVRGSTNGDGRIDLSDAVQILDWLFRAGASPAPMEAGDTNDDGRIDIGDPIYLIGFLFLGGPPPPPPWPDAGQDLSF